MILHVGFTGNRNTVTLEQQRTFGAFISILQPRVFHHGDCVGADEAAHHLVVKALPECIIEIHPPTNRNNRANCKGTVVHESKDYLERNKDIVRASHRLVAMPLEVEEQFCSGTWSTIRFALALKKPVYVIRPDGLIHVL